MRFSVMKEYQQPNTTELELDLEQSTLVTASTEKMKIVNDEWDD